MTRNITIAHLKLTPLEFIKRSLFNSSIIALFLSVFASILLDQMLKNNRIDFSPLLLGVIVIFFIFPLVFMFIFTTLLSSPLGAIRKRKRDIEREVLFAGRYLLVKLNSGKPLLNSLIDASKSYGVGALYFKEIVDDITLGTSLEEALQRAMNLTPSDSFRKILFQINNALLLGVDVSTSLRTVLEEITADQLTKIDAYSHKLNSIAMFYMLIAVVIPSLGLTIFVVVAGMVGFNINSLLYGLLWGGIVLVQFFFIHVFRSIRPDINF